MDFQKEREAFESWWEGFHNGRQIACDYVEKDNSYSVGYANAQWVAWQAKAQAVPDTYTPIVLALEDVQSKIAQASFLTMDADNENEVYAVDANELHEYIAELIEAQEPAND